MVVWEDFDAAIIGGGPAGCAAAIILARRGLRTVLIERSDYSSARIGETMPPAIRPHLQNLGVWESFLKDHHIESFAIRSAWGEPKGKDNEHMYNPYGSGWHVDRARFDRMLSQAASEAGASVLMRTRVTEFSEDDRAGWRFRVADAVQARTLSARFLIDAAGRTASLPASLNLRRRFKVLDKLIGDVRFFAAPHEPYTLIEADASGWWYSAPLPGGMFVVAYMTDADLHADDRTRKMPKLTQARVGSNNLVKKRSLTCAASLLRWPVCGKNWLAAGDAAMAFDPLSGQGVYKAIEGGVHAAEIVVDRLAGASESFSPYTAWVSRQFKRYLEMRAWFYGVEQRWPDSTFWQRRQARPPHARSSHVEGSWQDLLSL